MKIAVFYPTTSTAWSITKGICSTLKRMRHEVTDCGEDYNRPLDDQHLIIVSGPEYLWKSMRAAYPAWDSINIPKVGWLHETVEREDYETNPIAVGGKLPLNELKRFTPFLFTPAIQDQKYDLKFLPCGVDTAMFYPSREHSRGKMYTGALYKKRRDFLNKYPEIRTLAAYREYKTIQDYSNAVREAEVILNLPSLTEASSARTFEVLSSKTPLIATAMAYPDGLFVHGEHLLYYSGSPAAMFDVLNSSDAEKIAQKGYEEVLLKHTVEHRMKEVFRHIGRPLRLGGRFERKR